MPKKEAMTHGICGVKNILNHAPNERLRAFKNFKLGGAIAGLLGVGVKY